MKGESEMDEQNRKPARPKKVPLEFPKKEKKPDIPADVSADLREKMPENNEEETEKTLKEVVGFFLDPTDYALTDGMRNVKDMLGKMLCEARKVLKEEAAGKVAFNDMILSAFNSLLMQMIRLAGKRDGIFDDRRDATWLLVQYELCSFMCRIRDYMGTEWKANDNMAEITYFLSNTIDLDGDVIG